MKTYYNNWCKASGHDTYENFINYIKTYNS